MATLASRVALLRESVASLLPQVDALCVYLNGHESIPDFLRHPKVLYAILSSDAGYRAGEAKFWFWDGDAFKAPPTPWDPDTIGLVVDDDIVYPTDYARRMIAALERRPGTVACVHGSILSEPFASWRASRRCSHFQDPLEEDLRVHVPGTGTIAFRAGDVLPYSIQQNHRWSHLCDIAFAVFAHRRELEVWAVPRRARWLLGLSTPGGGFAVAKQRIMADVDQIETETIKGAAPWPSLPIPAAIETRAAEQRSRAARLRQSRGKR